MSMIMLHKQYMRFNLIIKRLKFFMKYPIFKKIVFSLYDKYLKYCYKNINIFEISEDLLSLLINNSDNIEGIEYHDKWFKIQVNDFTVEFKPSYKESFRIFNKEIQFDVYKNHKLYGRPSAVYNSITDDIKNKLLDILAYKLKLMINV